MPLPELLETYLAVRNAGGSPRTAALHRQALRRFAETLGRAPRLADLTAENLGRHANRRLECGVSRWTVRVEQKRLLALWRFAAERNQARWPDAKPIKAPARAPVAFTRDELNRLWQACDFAEPMGACPGNLWWRSLISVMWDTAERKTAVLSVPWGDVDLERLTFFVRGEYRKGATADRAHRIAPETAALLARMPRDTPGPFTAGCHEATLYNRLSRLLRRAGLPDDSRHKFHCLRRTSASHYAAAGGDAQRLLGHTDSKSTAAYIDPRIVREPAPCDLLWRPGA